MENNKKKDIRLSSDLFTGPKQGLLNPGEKVMTPVYQWVWSPEESRFIKGETAETIVYREVEMNNVTFGEWLRGEKKYDGFINCKFMEVIRRFEIKV